MEKDFRNGLCNLGALSGCWASIPPGQGMHDIVGTPAKMMGSLGGGPKIGIKHGDCFAPHRMA